MGIILSATLLLPSALLLGSAIQASPVSMGLMGVGGAGRGGGVGEGTEDWLVLEEVPGVGESPGVVALGTRTYEM